MRLFFCWPSCSPAPDEGAAADAQHLAGDALRAGRREERDRLADVLRQTALAERRQPTRDLADRHRDRRGHARLDEAGRDRVHGDAARARAWPRARVT